MAQAERITQYAAPPESLRCHKPKAGSGRRRGGQSRDEPMTRFGGPISRGRERDISGMYSLNATGADCDKSPSS
jgi:hypothetical protein